MTLALDEPQSAVDTLIPKKARRGSGGRPSQEEALRRDARLIEIAAAMFMERGFDATTVDAVAEAASVGKATLYARHRDKAALFAAVVQRQIDRWLSVSAMEVPGPDERIEDVLAEMGRRMVAAILVPEAIAINRIVTAQAIRFPELAHRAHREAWQRSNASIATVLDHFVADGQIAVEDSEMAADLFLSLVVGRLSRLAMLGIAIDPGQVDRRVEAAVAVFLHGVARRP
ncbi:TetR/AcrR family transcriptional regulator [Lichenibacterium minor]|uniref:TetR/AcrR family transcriptional regulator n=1 Tax=Lichenibacterium minor TaxID=2316528 RepID=A0A4Q2TZ83_9HYPH|nr:TetR/AcrR family transcriptional regulator [Lichenibacterium minor]RYC29060.1 TetR/AcrR family transcriptional regulator [Lichenibacterium minor]